LTPIDEDVMLKVNEYPQLWMPPANGALVWLGADVEGVIASVNNIFTL
jgi:hypothetical protein